MMTGKKPKNHPLCKINKQVRLKSAVEILGVLTPPLKMTALLFEARVGKRSQRGEIYPPWKGISWAITGTRKEKAKMETIDPRSVKSIRLKVYLADYQGSDGKISSDLTTIPMK